MADARPGLRVALVVDSLRVSGYVVDLVEALRTGAGAHLALVVAGGPVRDAGRRAEVTGAARAPSLALARMMLGAEAGLLRALGPMLGPTGDRARHIRTGTVDISAWFEHAVELRPGVDAGPALPRIDVALVLGDWIPRPGELDLGEADVLQLELGGLPPSRTPLAGFAEVLDARDRTRVRLYRLDRAGGARTCLVDGMNRTRPLFSLNQAALWGRAISLVVDRVARGRAGLVVRSAPPDDPEEPAHDAAPDVWRVLGYPSRIAARAAGLAAARLRGPRQWWIEIGPADAASPGARADRHAVIAPAGSWYADPFLYRCPRSGVAYCFVEEFVEAMGRARIAVLEQTETGWRRLGVALEEPHHLSFPFVFEHDGDLYMCPESCAARGVFVYRCEVFPLRWVRVATLMSDVSATDTVLFPHGQRWWMLTNIDRSPSPDHQSELHVFHAASPLSDTWNAVPGNPVKVDCHGGRNGGLLVDGGVVHRIGQVQSFDAYGKHVNVYRITRLDEQGYAESLVARLGAPDAADVIGTHSFSSIGNLTAIDLSGRGGPHRGRHACTGLAAAAREPAGIRIDPDRDDRSAGTWRAP